MANPAWHHLYNTARWKARRRDQLTAHPLCQMCEQVGKITAATVADHIKPHKGDETLFFEGSLQSLCKPCHDRHKQRAEKSGHLAGCDENGWPLDPNHSWRA